jgi:phosphoserine phosphatase RsbU/P
MSEGDSGDIQDLQHVLEITRRLAVELDLQALLELIIDRSVELLDADRGCLWLYDSATHELYSSVATGVEEIRFPADQGIAGAAVRSGQVQNVPDAYADERFYREIDRQTGYRTRTILALPLRDYQGETVGVLQIINKHAGPFTAGDEHLAETLAAQAGVALQRARLMDHYARKQEMERAMAIAREIQQSLLPQRTPELGGYELAGFNKAADDTGGDTYDFLPLDDGRCMLTVADATGHGIGPALVIAEARAMLRAIARKDADVSTVLEAMNELLYEDLRDERFVTCFLGVLDPSTHRLTYASAGHGPMLFYSADRDEFEQVNATGLPLAILGDAEYDTRIEHEFAPGDFVVVLTDGFFEADSPSGEMFGMDRVMELLRENRDRPVDEMIDRLHQAVRAHAGSLPQGDDLTAVILRRG